MAAHPSLLAIDGPQADDTITRLVNNIVLVLKQVSTQMYGLGLQRREEDYRRAAAALAGSQALTKTPASAPCKNIS
ncbi:MAG TPA: hypothetical protein VN519_10880 [Bryobacteraceae bacterium]|nr:hypothetical protein [Bryobacteraceae bacterium]